MVEVASSFRRSRPGRLNCVEESSLVVGQDGLGFNSKGRHFVEEGFIVSLCFSGRSPLASGILQLSGNTPWIVTSYAKRFGEDQEKVPSMMMWGA